MDATTFDAHEGAVALGLGGVRESSEVRLNAPRTGPTATR